MTGGLNFWDTEIWSFIITLSVLFGGMLLAVLLTFLYERPAARLGKKLFKRLDAARRAQR